MVHQGSSCPGQQASGKLLTRREGPGGPYAPVRHLSNSHVLIWTVHFRGVRASAHKRSGTRREIRIRSDICHGKTMRADRRSIPSAIARPACSAETMKGIGKVLSEVISVS